MASPKLIAVGDNCLDVYLTKGFLAVGGNALNVAVQWRRRGIEARYFGALGRDGGNLDRPAGRVKPSGRQPSPRPSRAG